MQNDTATNPSMRARNGRGCTSTLMRDFGADWRRWKGSERAFAILGVAIAIATPMGVALAALTR
jgi:hypothetical protein